MGVKSPLESFSISIFLAWICNFKKWRARRFSRLPNFAGGNAKVSKLSFNVGACEGIKPKKGGFSNRFHNGFCTYKEPMGWDFFTGLRSADSFSTWLSTYFGDLPTVSRLWNGLTCTGSNKKWGMPTPPNNGCRWRMISWAPTLMLPLLGDAWFDHFCLSEYGFIEAESDQISSWEPPLMLPLLGDAWFDQFCMHEYGFIEA